MEVLVEQPCPQCGGQITLNAAHRLLTCPYCGVKNFMQAAGAFRFILPVHKTSGQGGRLLYAPYIRFKGNVFQVNDTGISYRVVDTTQDGFPLSGLPPSLGLRPQAMPLLRVNGQSPGRFLRLSVKLSVILQKVARLNTLAGKETKKTYHQAFIGEELSYIYLPLRQEKQALIDAVVNAPLVELEKVRAVPLKGIRASKSWQVKFTATLCPRCGWSLDGEGDALVLHCLNCETSWSLGNQGLKRITAAMVQGNDKDALYLPFWKISAHLPSLNIWSFADFLERTNQPVVVGKLWRDKVMSFLIPAFKLRPKTFLHISKQSTLNQWALGQEQPLHTTLPLYPVTLPLNEARQSIKVVLAASSVSRKRVFPYLPGVHPENLSSRLVYLPFTDRQYDWLQPRTRAVIIKSVLNFGRSL